MSFFRFHVVKRSHCAGLPYRNQVKIVDFGYSTLVCVNVLRKAVMVDLIVEIKAFLESTQREQKMS